MNLETRVPVAALKHGTAHPNAGACYFRSADFIPDTRFRGYPGSLPFRGTACVSTPEAQVFGAGPSALRDTDGDSTRMRSGAPAPFSARTSPNLGEPTLAVG